MTFYNYIENVRYEMFKLVNDWTYEGAKTKARISESLDKARWEHMQMEVENANLQKLVQYMWPVFIGEKRATFGDRLRVRAEIDKLKIKIEQ